MKFILFCCIFQAAPCWSAWPFLHEFLCTFWAWSLFPKTYFLGLDSTAHNRNRQKPLEMSEWHWPRGWQSAFKHEQCKESQPIWHIKMLHSLCKFLPKVDSLVCLVHLLRNRFTKLNTSKKSNGFLLKWIMYRAFGGLALDFETYPCCMMLLLPCAWLD